MSIALLIMLAGTGAAFAQGEAASGDAASAAAATGTGFTVWLWWLLAVGASIFALVNAKKFFGEVMAADEGDARM